MECALWLNRRKVYSADEIASSPDIASLRGYFLAGSLIGWLNEHGGAHYARELGMLRCDDPELNEKLAEIFGGSPEDGLRFGEGGSESAPASVQVGSSLVFRGTSAVGSGSFSLPSSYGSLARAWGVSAGSFRLGSGGFGSGTHEWEWEWEWLFRAYRGGSFTSFSAASFGAFGRARFFGAIRSGSFGSFSFGSFWSMGHFGSFPLPGTIDLECLDEYDRIMLETLMLCPLDRFGYGIHNI